MLFQCTTCHKEEHFQTVIAAENWGHEYMGKKVEGNVVTNLITCYACLVKNMKKTQKIFTIPPRQTSILSKNALMFETIY